MEQVLILRREPDNVKDKQAVAVIYANGRVVDHIPWNVASIVSPFLLRNVNKRKHGSY